MLIQWDFMLVYVIGSNDDWACFFGDSTLKHRDLMVLYPTKMLIQLLGYSGDIEHDITKHMRYMPHNGNPEKKTHINPYCSNGLMSLPHQDGYTIQVLTRSMESQLHSPVPGADGSWHIWLWSHQLMIMLKVLTTIIQRYMNMVKSDHESWAYRKPILTIGFLGRNQLNPCGISRPREG